MLRNLHRLTATVLLIGLSAASLACGDGTAPETPNTRVFLSGTPEPATSTAAQLSAQTASPAAGGISIEAVDSINIELYGIAAIQPTDTANLAAQLETTGAGRNRINFRFLPPSGVDSVEVARGRLPPGTYGSLRLRFRSASITFNRDVTVGGVLYTPGSYQLDIPSGLLFAADAPSNTFTLRTGGEQTSVNINFDVGSSVATIGIGSVGLLRLTPIFRATATTQPATTH